MNKKIFTLLAGAFMMFAAVFSANAQTPLHGLWSKSQLNLGDSVPKLVEGYNPGYYHLRVDSVWTTNGTTGSFHSFQDSMKVLYMGKVNTTDGTLELFIDSLNNLYNNNPLQFDADSKGERSAASLWCVNIKRFDQGKNIIFDFINKQQKEMLEVDIYGYETWPKNINGNFNPATAEKTTHTSTNIVPGGVSGWQFSKSYATALESAPMFSYITSDTVAVLCMKTQNRVPGLDSVYVKIAGVRDLDAGKIDGVIYFRLVNAAPFVLDATDYNTMFGTKAATNGGRLVFNGDVTSGYSNPFSQGNLTANYLPTGTSALSGMRITIANTWHPWDGTTPNMPITNHNYDTVRYTTNLLDSLGYMQFSSAGKVVQVKRQYFEGNVDGNQFLKVELGDPYVYANDSLFLGQYAFRMVYYPSGDSIYINPYQATYLPLSTSDAAKDYGTTSFTDSATLAVFSYYADSAALQKPKDFWWPGTLTAADTLEMVTARLKCGFRTRNFYETYLYHQQLYVSLQSLNNASRLTLNSTENIKNNKINTRIHFGLYDACGTDTQSDKVTVPSDVYLIRNTAGQYLQVPLYSATDSALWVYLEKDVDPRYVPSFHWVVEQRYPGSTYSPVKITNREFDWLKFENVQLYEDLRPIRLRNKQYTWNYDRYTVNSKVTDWDNRDGSGKGYAFIQVGKEFKNNELLGYTWIDPDTSVVNQYAFEYQCGLANSFMGWDGDFKAYPNTDTLIYVNYGSTKYDKVFFTLDTIHENGYGSLEKYGYEVNSNTQIADLVTLKRQPYRLVYKNPFKYTCQHEFSMTPDENDYYSITKKGFHRSYLGKPVFYLRHVYKADGKDPYFALVQRVDSTTINSYTHYSDALEEYLEKKYGKQLADSVMNRLKIAKTFNQGLFVAKFEEQTAKLLMTLRADVNNTVTTFSLVKDVDPLYRRFNTTKEGENDDNPDYVHFFSQAEPYQKMYEIRGGKEPQYWNPGKKNYLGIINVNDDPNMESTSSTTIFVDTAYVNRGTGYIKPQYMLAVRPNIVEAGKVCDQYGEPTIDMDGYVEADYLINAYDSAYTTAGINQDYIWKYTDTNNPGWVRLVFTRAIHANDYLYILGNATLPNDLYGKLKDGNKMFDLAKLHTYAMRTDNDIHAIYLGNNLHKDCVFSFRLVERGSDDFIIESETTNRDVKNGPMIAPCEGGWLKTDNGPMLLTPSDEVDGMNQGLIMNVYKADADEKATGTDDVETSNVTVVGGTGAVTILNAAGKTVVINNILGQTVKQTVLTSDNQTIPVSKGIVIVSIDGEDTVKTLVK